MNRWQKLAGGGALALGLAVGAASQAGAVVIDSWNYTLNHGFDNVTPNSVVGTEINPVLNLPTKLSWLGSLPEADRSSLTVESTVDGIVQTNGPTAPGGTLTHNNFTIPFDPANFLNSGTLRVQLDLTPNTPPEPGAAGPISTFFDFAFKETLNEIDPCGFASTGASGCDDIFLLVGSGDTSQEFTFEGETYTAIFGATPLAPLDAETCGQLGLTQCIGFLTPEGLSTPFPTFIQVVHEGNEVPVPEPGILALLGTGLIALGAIRRRKAA